MCFYLRIERLWREVWAGVTSVYYTLFYSLENDGILDPNSEVHIMLLHLVFVPRIQAHLDRFTEALRQRPLRTENNRTPLQLWLTSRHPPCSRQVIISSLTYLPKCMNIAEMQKGTDAETPPPPPTPHPGTSYVQIIIKLNCEQFSNSDKNVVQGTGVYKQNVNGQNSTKSSVAYTLKHLFPLPS